MPTVTWDTRRLRYMVDEEADSDPIAFVNPVGYGAWVWSWLQPAVAPDHSTLVWDLPGTGASEPAEKLRVEDLAEALETILSSTGFRTVHLVGAGLGGAIACEYTRQFSRARSLVLFGTPATGEAVNRERLDALALATPEANYEGSDSLTGAFSPEYRSEAPDIIAQIREWRQHEDATGDAWDAQAEALCAYRPDPLFEITVPALVGHGINDPVVPLSAGRDLADRLPRAEFVPIDGRRLAFVESSRAVADRVTGFLPSPSP